MGRTDTEKIINKHNWFLAEIIERCEQVHRDKNNPNRRCVVWGNYHLIKASSLSEAYKKAVTIGKSHEMRFRNEKQQEMEWAFVGIGDILPVYEDIEDGAELLWTDYGVKSVKKSESYVFPLSYWLKKRNSQRE